ncbi:MAG: competence/damage-inducible protein A [Defluviicoccus sp.]|nr:MAG: competence/damage-inducible protein A [Defluviicoccus sp.]
MSESVSEPAAAECPTGAAVSVPVTACVLIIGNEILSGRTQDVNLAYLAKTLNEVGIRVMEARVIRDDERAIVDAVNACRVVYDYVFTTGGIGPTHDDITSACIARAFGVPIVRDPEAERLMRVHYGGVGLNAARLKMADVPQGSSLIENPVSSAPGFQIGNVIVLAGVPRILQAMVDGLKGRLRGGETVLSRTVSAFTTESAIAAGLSAVQDRYPQVEIGSYPFARSGRFGTSLVSRSTDADALAAAVDDILALLQGMGVDPIRDDAPSAA